MLRFISHFKMDTHSFERSDDTAFGAIVVDVK
jgi:hypothetical protein